MYVLFTIVCMFYLQLYVCFIYNCMFVLISLTVKILKFEFLKINFISVNNFFNNSRIFRFNLNVEVYGCASQHRLKQTRKLTCIINKI